VDDSDEDVMDVGRAFKSDIKDKGKAKTGKPKQTAPSKRDLDDINSDEEEELDDDDDEMSDFIVQSDEDEEEKDVRRSLRHLSRRRAIVIDSEDDMGDSPEEKEVIFGAKKSKGLIFDEQIKLMPRFLPSTKMKVS
jgi:hypothetical protein